MCKNCENLTIRLECIILAIAEIIISVAFIAYVCNRGYYDTKRIVLLVTLCFGTIAGLCLLLGAVLRYRVLVLIWIAIICPVLVVAVIACCLILGEKWNFIKNQMKAWCIVMVIAGICCGVYMIYVSCLLAVELKTGERQKRYPDCIGCRYPRGIFRERAY